jgi:alcohol dehydrogenase
MKGISLQQPGAFAMVDLAEPPPPGPGEARVRVHAVGICGTDYSGYLGRMPFYSYPRIPGHELGVEVLAVGPDVTNVRPGDRCAVEPYLNCGHCVACRRGGSNCCANLQILGIHTDGGLRPELNLPARKLHPSARLSYDQLALVETLGIGGHAVARANPQPDDTVLVIGAGPIGLSVIQSAHLTGARVIALDLDEPRLARCRQMLGVTDTVLATGVSANLRALEELTRGDFVNIVIDATGNHKSMAHALKAVAPTGKLVFVGIAPAPVALDSLLLHRREVTVLASRNSLPTDFTRIIRQIETGSINTQQWLTHTAGFEEFIAVFPTWLKPATGVIKAMVHLS